MLKFSILVFAAIFIVSSAAPYNKCTSEAETEKSASCLKYFESTFKHLPDLVKNITMNDKDGMVFMNNYCTSHQKCFDHFQNCVPDLFKTSVMRFAMKTFKSACLKMKLISSDSFYECSKKLQDHTSVKCIDQLFNENDGDLGRKEICSRLPVDQKCINKVVQEECEGDHSKEVDDYINALFDIHQCSPNDDSQEN